MVGKTRKNPRKRDQPKCVVRESILTMKDLSRLAHMFIAESDIGRPRWLKYENFKKPQNLVLTRVECSNRQMIDESNELEFLNELFQREWTAINLEVNDRDMYWDNLLNVHIPKRMMLKTNIRNNGDPLDQFKKQDEDNLRLMLLSTTEDMAGRMYPLPGYESEVPIGVPPIRATRSVYAPVTAKSPIFVIDCEMCFTAQRMSELTRITMLNEEGDTLLDTLVMPSNEIIDYVTCYSGITAELLNDCSTKLEDVQDAICRILPPDAIIAGHSIENDLRALRIAHPYCIDVALGYTMTNRRVRTSLRGLTFYYFNEHIQTSKTGHCSYQDAWATLRLLKLKLKNGKTFGDIASGFNYPTWATEQQMPENAFIFKHSASRDFAKEPPITVVDVKTPKVIGSCTKCDANFLSQCENAECFCRARCAKFCCLCVARDQVNEDPTEGFKFGEAVYESENAIARPTLRDLLESYPNKHVMVARYTGELEQKSADSTQRYQTFDMSLYKGVKTIGKRVLDSNLMSNELCLLEYDARDGTLPKLDKYLRAVHGRLNRNSMLGVLMCAPEKICLYLNIKT